MHTKFPSTPGRRGQYHLTFRSRCRITLVYCTLKLTVIDWFFDRFYRLVESVYVLSVSGGSSIVRVVPVRLHPWHDAPETLDSPWDMPLLDRQWHLQEKNKFRFQLTHSIRHIPQYAQKHKHHALLMSRRVTVVLEMFNLLCNGMLCRQRHPKKFRSWFP